jgi:hypothetical protein
MLSLGFASSFNTKIGELVTTSRRQSTLSSTETIISLWIEGTRVACVG